MGIPIHTPKLSLTVTERQLYRAIEDAVPNVELYERVKGHFWWSHRRIEMDPQSYAFLVGLAKFNIVPQALGRSGNSGKPLSISYISSVVETVASYYRWTRAIVEAQESDENTGTLELSDILRLVQIQDLLEENLQVYPLGVMYLGIEQHNISRVAPEKASGVLHKLLALFHATR